jgi:polysaccharide deacetylase family protein (PEP-CTERM system associated)
MSHVFSIDLEEWFCVSNFESVISPADWSGLESRVEESTDRILAILDRHDVRATFFVLGWVAERNPGLIRRIADRGHELASHGYAHRLVYEQSPAEFREDLERSLAVLQDATGVRCVGYRAPSFSLRRDLAWAWETLADNGILYDSSVFPVRHDRYGEPDAPRTPYRIRVGDREIVEFPPSTVRLFGKNLPVAGGGYFRLYPAAITRWAVSALENEGATAVVYLHPWEFDPGHPKPEVSRSRLIRHRIGLTSVTRKLEDLFGRFRFGTMRDALHRQGFALEPPLRSVAR